MKKCLIKILIISMYVMIISTFLINVVSMASVSSFSGSTSLLSGTNAQKATTSIIGAVLDITRIVGVAAAIGVLIVIACKYLVASAGDRADIKKYAVNYVIGAFILFGASGILTIIRTFVSDTIK